MTIYNIIYIKMSQKEIMLNNNRSINPLISTDNNSNNTSVNDYKCFICNSKKNSLTRANLCCQTLSFHTTCLANYIEQNTDQFKCPTCNKHSADSFNLIVEKKNRCNGTLFTFLYYISTFIASLVLYVNMNKTYTQTFDVVVASTVLAPIFTLIMTSLIPYKYCISYDGCNISKYIKTTHSCLCSIVMYLTPTLLLMLSVYNKYFSHPSLYYINYIYLVVSWIPVALSLVEIVLFSFFRLIFNMPEIVTHMLYYEEKTYRIKQQCLNEIEL